MKRALIVDDSRSARVILGRMLESYGLGVDAAESAEQALEMLRQSRPDVIFMDHLMPGMDGFQAVQAIKGNPETAMIPVVMYTSQEGELYVSQARALGAVGVLPKTVKQVDVSRVLYQLRLLPERREARTVVVHEGGQAAARVTSDGGSSQGDLERMLRATFASMLKEHSSEMRRFVLASFEAFARRLTSELKPAAAAATAQPAPITPEPVESPEPAPSRWSLAAGIAALALLPTLVLAALYMRLLDNSRELMQSNTRLAAVVEEQQAQLATLQQTVQLRASTQPVAPPPPEHSVEIETVPYGEAPLSGSRLERLRELVERLKASDFKGTLKVSTFVGEFCLVGNGVEGYSLAADELPMRRCDRVGNPFDDGLSPAQRQSLAFANLLASLRQAAGSGLSIEIEHAGRRPLVPYPTGEQLANLTAGEWNKIAARNNRVEFAPTPSPAGS